MIIQSYIAAQGVLQALGRIEAGGGQHFADTAIEALHHAIGLGMTGLGEGVFDAVLRAGAVKAMTSGRIAYAGGATAIGKCLAVIGQHLLDLEGRFIDKPLAKIGGLGGCFLAENFHVHPAAAPSIARKR